MRKLATLLLALLFGAPPVFAQNSELSDAQREVVETEKAFARYCVENGIRAAWLEFFADDGIIFQPGPVNSKTFYRDRPAQAKPPKVILNWEPRYGDASQAGDLAYNIGPWNLDVDAVPKAPTEHGYFMSVWKKQPDGKWKVALDFGSGRGAPATADHVFGKPFQAAPHYKVRIPAGTSAAAEFQTLMELDREVQKTSLTAGALRAYRSLVANDARIMRAAQAPADKQSIGSFISADKSLTLAFDPVGGDVAMSHDLGYTYGSYALQAAGQTKEKGYYAHVYKRSPAGKWQVVASNTEQVDE